MKLTRWIIIVFSLSLLTCTTMKDKKKTHINSDISWEKVDSLNKKGLYRTAWDEVKLISEMAQEKDDMVNELRSVFYQMRFSREIEEGSDWKNMHRLEARIETANEPLKSILHSVCADLYWSFYQNNRYQILNRIAISGEVPADKNLWSAVNFIDKINEHYDASLQQKTQLFDWKLADVDAQFFTEDMDEIGHLRVSMYDLLAQRALQFYSHSEAGLTRPNNFFTLNDERFFTPTATFASQALEEAEVLSFDRRSVELYQDLLSYYSRVHATEALIDTDLNRLMWIYNKSNLNNKDSLMIHALDDLISRFPQSPMVAEVIFNKAERLNQQGALYDPMAPEERNHWKKKEALALCEDVLEKFPDTRGAELCANLKTSIRAKNLNIINESVVLPDMSSLVRVEYKNTDKVYARIVETLWNHQDVGLQQEKIIKKLFAQQSIHSWTIQLKASEDYQTHSTEILLPALPAGHYTLVLSTDEDFTPLKTLATYNDLWVSHIAVVSKNDSGESTFRLLHRSTGIELKGALVEQYEQDFDRKGNIKKWNLVETYTADRDGEFETVNFKGYQRYYLKVKWKGEELIVPHYSNGRYSEQQRERYQTHFFIDRGIYRPGQTLHFKAIILHHKGNDVTVAKNKSTQIVLRDANYQEIVTQNLQTNEFGTVQGTFTIPDNGLTGSMTLADANGNKSFQVEEYKRPKFQVEIYPIKGAYKLGEKVTVEGKAVAYSGANLQNAEVKYAVYRRPQVKWFYGWDRCYVPPYAYSENVKITDGTIHTREDGSYTFVFDAVDGGDGDQRWIQYYSYDIAIEVTDVNGETQVGNTSVHVGKDALVLDLGIPDLLNLQQTDSIDIVAENLNGEPIPTTGKITIYTLKGPEPAKVDRYWGAPDQLNYTEEELREKMPVMSYPGWADKSKWKRTEVQTIHFDSSKNKTIETAIFNAWKDGEYCIVMEAIDSFGKPVKKEKYFKGYTTNNRYSFSYSPLEAVLVKPTYLPGEKVHLLLNSAMEDMRVKVEVEHDGAIVKEEYILLTKGKKTFSYPVKRAYQGGFSIHVSGYKDNRYFTKDLPVNVPHVDKKLTLSLETFRDKMLPGSKEEWKIKVKADNGDKVVSEVLLNMYDASLDQFVANSRWFDPFTKHYARLQWRSVLSEVGYGYSSRLDVNYKQIRDKKYPSINQYQFYPSYVAYGRRNRSMEFKSMEADNFGIAMPTVQGLASRMDVGDADMEAPALQKSVNKPTPTAMETAAKGPTVTLAPRTNFNETAFFYPDLMTDKDGNLLFKFTLPESLTTWKFQAFAHTTSLQYGMMEEEMISQKDVMVVPNMPRFFRKGDEIVLSTKIVNISDKDLSVTAGIHLFDAFTMQDITDEFISAKKETHLDVKAGGQELASWQLSIGDRYEAVTWRIYANSNTHSDAEENSLPILSNRSLVTETLPFALVNKKTLNLTMDKLKNNESTTLKNHSLTLEYNSNPVWYAVQAMPYMMEYPYDCSEQIFTRYYANALSTHIMNSKPRMKQVINSWKRSSPDTFLSKLEKNQELKSIVLEESPWVLQSQDETERKKRISLLLDLNHMAAQRRRASLQLKESQLSSGAWPWFKGMRPNLYITQYVISGFGHLDKLGVDSKPEEESMIMRGLDFMDSEHLRRFQEMKRYHWKPEENHTTAFEVQYLYARSFFPEQNFRTDREAYDYYLKQVKAHWLEYNNYIKGMIALVLFRHGDTATAQDILRSLLETSIHSDELGMYWKEDVYSWNWYEPTTERHALLIEAFNEINKDQATVNALKSWMIMNKRTNDWKTTKATAEACYALLLQGSDWMEPTSYIITIGKEKIDSQNPKVIKEAGTGYIKKVWRDQEVKTEMADIIIEKKGDSPSWGAVYWQYFEDLDKITAAEGPMVIHKNLYKVTETADGEKLVAIKDANIRIGDRLRVRLDVTTDRNMEYVHIKDQRASSLEPLDVLSRYNYQGGLGYYQSTKDAATHFFIDYLAKGTYVLDYDLFVSHEGDLSNGFALIECMYAPEFGAHSEGLRLQIAHK